jgi:hypothetical protein
MATSVEGGRPHRLPPPSTCRETPASDAPPPGPSSSHLLSSLQTLTQLQFCLLVARLWSQQATQICVHSASIMVTSSQCVNVGSCWVAQFLSCAYSIDGISQPRFPHFPSLPAHGKRESAMNDVETEGHGVKSGSHCCFHHHFPPAGGWSPGPPPHSRTGPCGRLVPKLPWCEENGHVSLFPTKYKRTQNL